MASRARPPTYREVPVQPTGKHSILLELYASRALPTYSQAFYMDIKRGVDADLAQVPDEPFAVPNDRSFAVPASTVAEASLQPVAPGTSPAVAPGLSIPSFMATGGHGPFSSFSASPSLTPVRSRSGSTGNVLSVPASQSVAPARGNAPADQLSDAGRNLALSPVHATFANKSADSYVGYAVKLEIYCPQNLEEHIRGDPQWEGKYVLVKDSNGSAPLKFYLLLDTGGGVDSWVFCNLPYADLKKFQLDTPFLPFHEEQYYKRSRMDVPPQSHRNDPDNTAILKYGVGTSLTKMEVAQTVVKFHYKQRNHARRTLPEFPIGAVIGLSPEDLERGEGGLLALGRTQYGKSSFKKQTLTGGVRWKSQTLVKLLVESKNITEHFFTIFIDHPLLVESEENCIIFGPIFNPQHPHIPDEEEAWTTIPVRRACSHWKVFLREIRFVSEEATYVYDISRWMKVDNGASQTYLPKDASVRINNHLLNKHGGNFPKFDKDDTVVLIFEDEDGVQISITGQAKRFFTSPYRSSNGGRKCCVSDTASSYILGLNFFMTFMVAFEDCSDPYARILTSPHSFVDE